MGVKPIEMFYLKAFGVKVSLLFSSISFSQHLLRVPIVYCCITTYPKTQQLKILTIIYVGHKSATWLGLCCDSSSLFRRHQLGQLNWAGIQFADGSLTSVSSCWSLARNARWRQLGGLGFLHVTSLWDTLCLLPAWRIGSKNKCSKTQEAEAANFVHLDSETGTTSLQTAVLQS